MSDRDWLTALRSMPDSFGPWAGNIGMRPTVARPDCLQAIWTGNAGLNQPFGLVNGGVHCTVTETLGSLASAIWRLDSTLSEDDPIPDLSDLTVFPTVVGLSNHTDFYRPLRTQAVTSTATPIHTGRLQQVWQVVTVDDADRLVARGQVRIQNL